jgi:hypothetical protein
LRVKAALLSGCIAHADKRGKAARLMDEMDEMDGMDEIDRTSRVDLPEELQTAAIRREK